MKIPPHPATLDPEQCPHLISHSSLPRRAQAPRTRISLSTLSPALPLDFLGRGGRAHARPGLREISRSTLTSIVRCPSCAAAQPIMRPALSPSARDDCESRRSQQPGEYRFRCSMTDRIWRLEDACACESGDRAVQEVCGARSCRVRARKLSAAEVYSGPGCCAIGFVMAVGLRLMGGEGWLGGTK